MAPRFEEVELKLAGTSCPGCANVGLDLLLRCDLDSTACLYTARCKRCNAAFLVRLDRQDRDPVGDPPCGHPERRLSFRCELASKECFDIVICEHCRLGGS